MFSYEFWADVVALIHAGYVLFVVVGMGLIPVGLARGWRWVRNFWFRSLHLAAIAIVALEAVTGVNCPLTDLERVLRIQAGQIAYQQDFLVYWAHRLLFIDSVPKWVFDTGHVGFGLLVLVAFVLAPPRWPFRPILEVRGVSKEPTFVADASGSDATAPATSPPTPPSPPEAASQTAAVHP